MHPNHPRFILRAAVFPIAFAATAAKAADLTGALSGGAGRPLAGCSVFLVSSPAQTAFSDAQGRFLLPVVPTALGPSPVTPERGLSPLWHTLNGSRVADPSRAASPLLTLARRLAPEPLAKPSAAAVDTLKVDCPDRPWTRVPVPDPAGDLGTITVIHAPRPNIVIFIADDLTAADLPAFGGKDAKTPNLDRLASQGLRFTRAFATTAMCSPLRQEMYTGLHPVRSGAYPNHSRVKDGTLSLVHHLSGLGYRVGIQGKRHFGPPESYPFITVGEGNTTYPTIASFLKPDGKPYCLVIASHEPHGPWNLGNPADYDPSALTLPPHFHDSPMTRADMAAYLAEVTVLDKQVGDAMAALDGSGEAANTLFLFSSEQGSSFPGGKWTCYDAGLRTGLIARWPGVTAAGAATAAMVSMADVTPTLVAAAGGKPIPGLDGRSFLGVLFGKTGAHRDTVYGVHTQMGAINSPPQGYPVRSLRTGRYKFIMNLSHGTTFSNGITDGAILADWKASPDPKAEFLVDRYLNRPAEELYDLASDPHELKNLAAEPARKALMESLRAQLQGWMAGQGDKGVATELEAPLHQAAGAGD